MGRNISRLKDGIREEFGFDLTPATQAIELLKPATIEQALASVVPDVVIHLAGISFVPDSFKEPRKTYEVNFIGTLNLLEALQSSGFTGTFLYVSSGDVYGQLRPEYLPVMELQNPRPLNPYAVSKVAAEALCIQWSQISNFKIVIARPFNHIGPGQREEFVIPAVARQIAEIKLGMAPPVIRVGDVDVSRDFLDVDDVIAAYLTLLSRGENGEIYNVCSGKGRNVHDIIISMIEMAGVQAELARDDNLYRPASQRVVIGSNSKLIEKTGWAPRKAIEATLQRVLDDWMERLKA